MTVKIEQKITTYWRLQIAGWGFYGLLYFVHLFMFRDFKPIDLFRIASVLCLGFCISNGLRLIYKKIDFISHSILYLSMVVLGCSLIASNIWFWGFRILWGIITGGWMQWNQYLTLAPFVKTLIPVFFDTVLLTSWSALYFTIKLWRAWNDQVERAQLAKNQAHTAQLQMIHYQLNPHFLFNALNAIRALIGEDKQQAKQMITELSEFMRYSLISKQSSIVPLVSELEAIHQYISIEKRRYEEKLQVQFVIDPQSESYPVMSFILYPLVENAIKHGMKTSSIPLKIKICSEMNDSTLILKICNTGRWIHPSNGKSRGNLFEGLSVVKKRLKNIYPDEFVFITEEEKGWVNVIIEIKKRIKPVHEETLQYTHR